MSPRAANSSLVRELWPIWHSREEALAWRAIPRPRDWRLPLLQQLTASAGPTAASHVLRAYYSDELPPGPIASMLETLAGRTTAQTLISAERGRAREDLWDRPDWSWFWRRLLPFKEVAGGWAAFAFATLSRSGFVRERAVQALAAACSDGRELLFLVLRTADHVGQVRAAAGAALEGRISAGNGAALLETLPLVAHLREHRQKGDAPGAVAVTQFLSSPEGWPVLSAGLDAADPAVHREAFSLALSGPRETEVLRRALHSPSQLVRLRALRRSSAQALSTDDLAAAARFPFVPIRMVALERFRDLESSSAIAQWTEALFDPSPSVRSLARRLLGVARPTIDLRTAYREAILLRDALPAAIAGLAEVGVAEDAADVILLTDHPRAKTREAVAGALARLLEAEAIDALLPMLFDPSRRVGRKAASGLSRHLTPPLASRVWVCLQTEPPSRGAAALRLFSLLPQWDALHFLLRAAQLDEPLRKEAACLLRSWHEHFHRNGSQVALSKSAATHLHHSLASLPEGVIATDARREIDFSLSFWMREGR